jgi:hypothetical protein
VGEQRSSTVVFLLQQCLQQVLRLDVGIILTDGKALRVSKRLLEFRREFVESHGSGNVQ